MLQTRIINKDACAVAWDPTEIMVRKRGRDFFGQEETLTRILNGELIINCDVAAKYGIPISCNQHTHGNRSMLVERFTFKEE